MPPTDFALRMLAVGVGGAVGAMARYSVGLACLRLMGDRYAVGTLLVNTLGCFALGVLMHEELCRGGRLPVHVHAGITAGLLGGLTTFSAFGYETVRHAERGDWGLAAGNVAVNLALGLAAAALGVAAGKRLIG